MSMLTRALGIDAANNMRTDIDTSQLEQMYANFNDPYANYDYYRRAMGDSQPTIETLLGTQAATGGSNAIANRQAKQYSAQAGENVLNRMSGDRLQREVQAANVANQLSQYDVQEIQLENEKQKALQSAAMQPFKLGANILSGGAFSPLLSVASKGLSGAAGLLGNIGKLPGAISQGAQGLANFGSGVMDAFQGGAASGFGAIGSGIENIAGRVGGLLGSAGQSVGNYYQGLQQPQAIDVAQPTYQNQSINAQITAPTTQTASPPPPPVAPVTAQPNNFTYSNYAVGGNVPTMSNVAFNMSTLPQQQMGGGFMGGGLFGLTNNFTLGGGYR